jgi:small conductance mechanosensitive channel
MEGFSVKIAQLESAMSLYGREVVIAFAVIVFGLILIKWINKGLKHVFRKLPISPAKGATVRNVITVLMSAALISFVAIQLGLDPRAVKRFLAILTLGVIGMIMVFRPLIPSLPFKVGNTVKIGDLLGKIEATTILNTRMRTFDGKTIFVPNRKILNDIVINYHFSDSRRIKIDVGIRYDQDLMKAKQILESIMIEDPRVMPKPAPVVYVLNLSSSCVELGGRCWVDNMKYWVTKCDLLEKTKYRFDNEGIVIAFPQLDVNYYNKSELPVCAGQTRQQGHRGSFKSVIEEDKMS